MRDSGNKVHKNGSDVMVIVIEKSDYKTKRAEDEEE